MSATMTQTRRRRLPPLLAISILLCSGRVTPLFPTAVLQPMETLALVGATVYPSPTEAPIAAGVVLLEGGKIVALVRGTR